MPASVKHIGHEGSWVGTPWGIDNIDYHCWVCAGKRFGNDGARGRPIEDFNLAWCINKYISTQQTSEQSQ